MELDRKALKEAETVAKAIVSEYRPTMDREVLASWAGDAVRCVNDLLASLEEAEGRMTEALTMTGSKDLADLIDMANIGRSMMERMAQVTESGPMRGWSPADDPAEIVTDLANRLDDALHDYGNAESEAKGLEAVASLTARAEASEQREAGLREALVRIKEISNPTVRIERPRLNLDRAWEIADAALTTKSGEA